MIRRWLVAALMALPLPAHAAAPVESFALENGLEVIVIPNHRVPAVSHMLWFKVGAADDPPGLSGLAHYHEHAMFLGTAQHKSGDYADIIARHGGDQNAFTGYDATSYYVNIGKENLPLIMELEADRLRGIAPSAESMKNERQVIIEERRARIENNPQALFNEQMNAALFRHHPYHLPAIGWMHEMAKLSKEDVMKFHASWYHPNNAILIISGDVTAAEIKPLANRYYGGLPRGKIPDRNWNEEPPQNNARRLTLKHKNVQQPLWKRSYMASSLAYGRKNDALPLLVLSQLLGGGKTSRLYQSLVVEQKIASEVNTGYDAFTSGPSQFHIQAVPADKIDPAQIEKAVDKELEKLLAGSANAEDLARAKTLLKAEAIYARDGLTSMARIMGWIRIAGLDADYFNRWPDLIEAVTAEQVAEAAKATFRINQSVTGLLLPEEGEKK